MPRYTPPGAGSGRHPAPALRPRAGALLRPHPDQPAAARGHAGERGLGERRRGRAPWGCARATACACATRTACCSNPVRVRATQAHPARLRLPGARLRPHRSGLLRRAFRKGASDAQLITRYAVDPLMGGTGMNVNFVTLDRGGGLSAWRGWEWSSTRACCVGCMDCVVACKTENQVPEGFNRDWITQRHEGALPDLAARDPQRALQPLRRPTLRELLPHRRQPRRTATAAWCWSIPTSASAARPAWRRCPYDARFVHPEGYADKCTFCVHRVEQGQLPACVSVCPTRCMHFGDLDDPHSAVARSCWPRASTTRCCPRPAPARASST